MVSTVQSRGATTVSQEQPGGHYGPAGRRFLLVVYGLVVLGIVFVFSSSFPRAGRPLPYHGDPYWFLKTQLLHAGIGLVAMIAISLVPLKWIERLSRPAFLVGLILMTAAAIWGRSVGDARCWIWGMQPSEFARIAYVAAVATLLARGPINRKNTYRVVVPLIIATVLILIVLMKQHDQGMALLVVLLALTLAYIGGARLRYLVPVGVAMLAAAFVYCSTKPYIVARVEAWLNPLDHIRGAGNHILHMLLAIARGGPFGMGLGMSPDKWKGLPVPHTDSIYCVIASELGLWGAVGLLVVIVMVAVLAFKIARRSNSRLGYFLAAGIGISLTLQALVNIAVATAVVPPTGLTLPFISAGGSSLVSSMIGAGLVLAVARHNQEHAGRR
ncbi:MAG: cell division protein FtsW [Armatimonadetes bacterium]|nr:cell division protein FtsW [Armatimonadota bacterium]